MRVQIPAYTDAWMKGDRFGDLVKVTKGRAGVRAALLTQDPRRYGSYDGIELAHVKLDKSGKTVRVVLADCNLV